MSIKVLRLYMDYYRKCSIKPTWSGLKTAKRLSKGLVSGYYGR